MPLQTMSVYTCKHKYQHTIDFNLLPKVQKIHMGSGSFLQNIFLKENNADAQYGLSLYFSLSLTKGNETYNVTHKGKLVATGEGEEIVITEKGEETWIFDENNISCYDWPIAEISDVETILQNTNKVVKIYSEMKLSKEFREHAPTPAAPRASRDRIGPSASNSGEASRPLNDPADLSSAMNRVSLRDRIGPSASNSEASRPLNDPADMSSAMNRVSLRDRIGPSASNSGEASRPLTNDPADMSSAMNRVSLRGGSMGPGHHGQGPVVSQNGASADESSLSYAQAVNNGTTGSNARPSATEASDAAEISSAMNPGSLRELNKLSEDFKELLDKGYYQDLKMLCTDAVVYLLHKNVLRVRAQVLLQILINNGGRVDEPSRIMKYLLFYIYCGKCYHSITLDVALELLPASVKFLLDGVMLQCALFLKEALNNDTVLRILVVANACNDIQGLSDEFKTIDLYGAATDHFLRNAAVICQTEEWMEFFLTREHKFLTKNLILMIISHTRII